MQTKTITAGANHTLHLGDNLATLKNYPDNTFDSIVTDPPYGITFLGKDWDAHTGTLELYKECLRVLKPGGYMLAFSAARTYHQLASNIELAGFEIRDQLMWLYASGFPKAQDIGKAIQKRLGVEEYDRIVDTTKNAGFGQTDHARVRAGVEWSTTATEVGVAKCTSPLAKEWEGFKTALKPAMEPLVLARKSTGVQRSLINTSVDETTHLMETLCILANNVVQHSKAITTRTIYQTETSSAQTSVEGLQAGQMNGETQTANMSALSEMEETILSIVSLWSSTSGAVSQVESTSTTETAINITTRLATLRSLLSVSIQESIILDQTSRNGKQSDVECVLKSLKDALLNLQDIHTECIALVNATNKKHTNSQGVTAKPAHEPIVMARKPFKGSTIDNVLKNGLGAMNIDATRVPWADEKDAEQIQNAFANDRVEELYGRDGSPTFQGTEKKKKSDREKAMSHTPQRQRAGDTTVIGTFGASGLIGTEVSMYNMGGRYPSNVIGEVEQQKYFYNPTYDYRIKPGTDSIVINMIKEFLCNQNTSSS